MASPEELPSDIMFELKELPSDIMFEILTRTRLETLDRCKAVCKGWKKLIYESTFMPLYCRRTNNVFGYFVQDIKDHKYMSMFVSIDQSEEEGGGGCISGSWPCDDMKILASCNQGILCCKRRKCSNYRYYTSKPATQQWQALPNPKLRYKTAGVVIMVLKSNPLHYKIIRLSELNIVESMMEYLCEIFDSRIWAWRKTQGVNLPYDELIIPYHPAVSIGEFVYWQTSNDNVLAFHIAQECFQKFSFPESVHNDDTYRCKRLVEYEERLGFTCLTEDGKMELWLKEGLRNYQWTRKMVVNIMILEKSLGYPYPVGFYNSGIAFMRTFYEAIFYKLQDCSFTKVNIDYDLRNSREIFQFRSDVEYVNLRGGR